MKKLITVMSACVLMLVFGIVLTACGHTHEWGEWSTLTSPTCTTAGTEVRVCEHDKDHKETRDVSATGHTYGEAGVITAATESADGLYGKKCNGCSHAIETSVLYATGTEGLSYTLINDNAEYSVSRGTITENDAIDLHIPAYHKGGDGVYKPVTNIAISAFYIDSSKDFKIKSVTISATVKTVGNSAFRRCKSLKTVTFAEGSQLTTIDSSAFSSCYILESIKIPDSVTLIDVSAFANDFMLTEINIPTGLTELKNDVFSNCGRDTESGMTSVVIPVGITKIGDGVFRVIKGSEGLSGEELEYIYYGGNATEWGEVNISNTNNANLKGATVLYYSETVIEDGWHYVNGVPTMWEVA